MRFRSHWSYTVFLALGGLMILIMMWVLALASSPGTGYWVSRPLDLPLGYLLIGVATGFGTILWAAALLFISVRLRGGWVEWVFLGRFVYRRRPAAASLQVRRRSAESDFPTLVLRGESSLLLMLAPRDLDRLDAHLKTLRDAARHGCGPPDTPVILDPLWLTPDVRRLALAAEGGQDPACLAVLSDALEDAGCTDADILAHLRRPGAHARGCWALDLLTGRE